MMASVNVSKPVWAYVCVFSFHVELQYKHMHVTHLHFTVSSTVLVVWAVLAWLFDPSTVVIARFLLSSRFTDSQNGMIMAALGHSAPQGRDVMGCCSGTY